MAEPMPMPMPMPAMTLSPEQEQGLTEFKEGRNLFLTGPGGSGKTELIKRMVASATARGKKVQVCALTGCAAILLNCCAKTVHSWAGIGLANGDVHSVATKVLNDKKKTKRWKDVGVLIIDEVSMMSQKLFELLDEIGKRTRKEFYRPFGGIQLVFSGDFYQLPPVSKFGDEPSMAAFCFESPFWPTTFSRTVQLKTIFRQKDAVYSSILNQVRVGRMYKSSVQKLHDQVGKTPADPLFKPTKLFPTRKAVDQINAAEYAALSDPELTFSLSRVNPMNVLQSDALMKVFDAIPETVKEYEYTFLANNLLVDPELRLKIGTQVMCVCNLNMDNPLKTVVNGSQGIVTGFTPTSNLPIVQFKNGVLLVMEYHTWLSDNVKGVAVTHIPLIYAWAVTIHKSQGASLDLAEIDAGSNIFECGQTYVALSRVKSLEGLYLTAFDPSKIKVNVKVQEFYGGLV